MSDDWITEVGELNSAQFCRCLLFRHFLRRGECSFLLNMSKDTGISLCLVDMLLWMIVAIIRICSFIFKGYVSMDPDSSPHTDCTCLTIQLQHPYSLNTEQRCPCICNWYIDQVSMNQYPHHLASCDFLQVPRSLQWSLVIISVDHIIVRIMLIYILVSFF